MKFLSTAIVCCWLLGQALLVCAAEPDETVEFERDIRPILSANCFACHGPDANKREAELRLDTREGAHSVLEPGESAKSELFRRISSDDPDERMPPPETKRELSAKQVALLKKWIDQGAAWGEHWAFASLKRPGVPVLNAQQSAVIRNAIDAFVQARLVDEKLNASPEAARHTLIRRVTLDLTGLPPTPEEVDPFLADRAPGAYERVVDRLLASPAFGQRMAWDWLDAARYADSNGYQGDGERTMWPWRDWVVGALNENLPYDDFTVWQLAGDLLSGATFEQRLATGFCRNHMINGEGGRIPEENRVDYVMDMSETMSTVWLGLTMTCCRCHDHKYDPLTQHDYYRMFAFFNQTPVDGGGGNAQTPPVLAAPTAEQRRQIEALERELAQLDANGGQSESDPKQIEEQRKQKQQQLDGLRKSLAKVMIMADRPDPRKTFMLDRGLYNKPGEEVTAAVPAMLPPLPADAPPNRLALARWLVASENPLTARVTVNRLWQQLFGVGLVKTTEDFGVQGEIPIHQELLDWLAVELRDNGWDVKQILRLIVTSHTYRQSSKNIAAADGSTASLYELDPENRLLARGPRMRLPSWMLRDQALAASGLLVNEIGGPPVNGYQPPGIWEEATFGNKKYSQDHGQSLYRRSLYTFWRRIIAPTMFFDNASRQVCTVKLFRTNTPLHALLTLNDVTYVEAARALAERVLRDEADSDKQRLDLVFRRLLARVPTDQERTILLGGLARSREQFQQDNTAAEQLLAVGESKRDDGLDAAEHAAWTTLCLAIFNLDEALTKE